MAITATTDLHSIQQIGTNAIGVAFAATPLLSIPGLVENVSGQIIDAGSESVAFTVWDTSLTALTQNAVRDNRAGVTPSKLSLSSYNEAAITKVISIDSDRFALNDASEDVINHLSNVVGREFSRTVQANLISQAVDVTNGTPLVLDISAASGTKTLNVADILNARLKWSEHASEIGSPYLFVSTKQFSDLAKDADFKSMANGGSTSPVLSSGDWNRFVVASVFGVNIVLLDSVPFASTKYTALMVGPGAFGVYVGDQPETVSIDHAGSAVKTLDTHFRFASTMFRHAPRRVVKLITL